MPLPPLKDPERLGPRLRGLAVGLPAAVFLFVGLLGFNLLQILSMVVWPFSGRAFRGFNRWAAGVFWGWCVTLSRRLHGIRIVVTGDPVPVRENAIVISNHQQMADITFLLFLAREKRRLGDLKWIVKRVIRWIPGVGWGMAFLGCLFVRRNWAADRETVRRTFERLVQRRVPVWLVSFPEGTRIRPEKLERARAFAREQGLPPPRHVLVPRSRGFVASVRGLGEHARAVYDVTIGYQEGVPTLWQYVMGYARVAHLHVRRFETSGLEQDDAALAAWLQRRFQEKDELLDRFYREGAFPSA